MDSLRNDNDAVISELQEQIKRLESRLTGVETHGKSDFFNETSGLIEGDASSSGAHGLEVDFSTIPFVPQVRKCNFIEFKNRFCEQDARYAVDVLVSGALFEQEYLEEQALRDRLFEHGRSGSQAAKKKAEAVKETNRNNDAWGQDQSSTWIRRIRLQAPALLQILAKVQGEVWSNRPRTYDRPFCTLLQFQPQVKQALAELEEKWDSQSEGLHTESSEGHHAGSGTMTPEDDQHGHQHGRRHGSSLDDEDSLDDSHATLDILRAYVDFIDQEVMPGSNQYDDMDFTSDARILFSDLCYLYKVGSCIYKPLEGEKSGDRRDPRLGGRDNRMGQRLWRIHFVNDAIRNYNLTPPDHRKYSTAHEKSEDDSTIFTVHAYHIDYTGDEFCVVTHTFRIAPFEGWRPVNALPIYPMRFIPNWKAYWEASLDVGEQVQRFVESKHAFYNAWTVIRTPQGQFATDANGDQLQHPEYINSEVMVDFGEAFQACPAWRPDRSVLKTEFTNKIVISDDFPIRWWSGTDRKKLVRETREIIPYRTGVHHLKRNKFVLEDRFLATVARNEQRGVPTTKIYLRDEEKVLLYCRVFAYVFRERKFAQLDVSWLTPSARNLDALEALKISTSIKSLIQGSVRGHFLLKEAEGRHVPDGMSLDIIQGKGTGLFILLHGVPGVGKTATAESIALANGKPLFKITCGDIGLTPDQVESSLRAIFRLASIWDCILLMDEVDTFFSQRSKGDSAITKNALVSVFLRVLDYYTGILFLTTNRSGALDEAFKSRIHYKIYYPPLTKNQAIDIWKLNIDRLRQVTEMAREKRPLEIVDSDVVRFASKQFDECEHRGFGHWNGRQIRNAFQVARSLAYYDALTNGDHMSNVDLGELARSAVLDVKYFQMMHDITESFDHYMLEVFGGSNDKDLALEKEHRADDFKVGRRGSLAMSMQQHDYDDRYHTHINRSDTYPDYTGRPRGSSHGGHRPSLPGEGTLGRQTSGGLLSPMSPSLSAGYDESSADDRNPSSLLQQPLIPSPPPNQQREHRLSQPTGFNTMLQQTRSNSPPMNQPREHRMSISQQVGSSYPPVPQHRQSISQTVDRTAAIEVRNTTLESSTEYPRRGSVFGSTPPISQAQDARGSSYGRNPGMYGYPRNDGGNSNRFDSSQGYQ